MTASAVPSYASNKKLNWTSNDENIARVSNGTITGVNPGTTFVHVSSTDGGFKDAAILVTVIRPVKKIVFASKSITVTTSRDSTISMNVEPLDASDKSVEWTSSNPSVATVSSSGTVTGKNAGTCIVTATARDGSGVKAKINVYVEPKDPAELDYLWWETNRYGLKTGRIKVDVVNSGVNRKIRSVNITVKCYNSAGGLMGTTYLAPYFGSGIGPGKRKTSSWCYPACSGLDSSTSKIVISLDAILFSDGEMFTYHYGEEPTSEFILR